VHEIVIAVADLYLTRAGPSQLGALPGLERAGRFGARAALPRGWRGWLAGRLARTDLNEHAPAAIASAALEAADAALRPDATSWLATPLHLSAGLTRVHLDHRGLLRLSRAEQAVLAAQFQSTFGRSGYELTPLHAGDFLLRTPGIGPLESAEPARCAGGEVAEALPRGAAAGELRRLLSEIEMWLHTLALNEERARRGAAPVTTLWLWGAQGRMMPAEPRGAADTAVSYGRDAWLEGLMRLTGGSSHALPERLLGPREDAPLAVYALEVGGELQHFGHATMAQALARLDADFISPALAALRQGSCQRLTILLNDVSVSLGRASHFKLWRRSRAGLESYA
jgi:hypothetical protein